MAVWRATVVIASPYLGGVGTNTWHARTESEELTGNSELASIASAIGTFYDNIETHFAGATTRSFDGAWHRAEDAEDGQVSTVTGFSETNGIGPPLPPANCLVVSWRTSSGSRSGRGRTFLGPMGTGCLQDNGTPVEAVRTQIESMAAAFITAVNTPATSGVGVWSRKDQTLRDFTSGTVANQFAVLRSRRD